MIVDSSAIVAIVLGENDREMLLTKMSESDQLRMSTANALECYIVIDGKREPHLTDKLEQLFAELPLEFFPVAWSHVSIARMAYRTYGKKSGHPAKLNFGDCICYALAKELDEPLLFKGLDFDKTDVRIALNLPS